MDPITAAAKGAERRKPDQPLRVLIADDDRDMVSTLGAILENEGHVVHSAYRGTDVLPAVRLFRPDVIVLDISVPGISGFAVAQEIRHSFLDIRRPLLIAISGKWTASPDRLVARQCGFDHYLVKPCDPRQLVELIAGLRRA